MLWLTTLTGRPRRICWPSDLAPLRVRQSILNAAVFSLPPDATKFKEAFEQGKVFNEQAFAAARAATSSPTKEKPEEKKDA